MIKSSTFGGVALSGDDARKFERQVRYGRASVAARETLKRGDELLQKFGGMRSDQPSKPVSLAASTPVLTFDDPRHGRRHYAVTPDILRMLRDWIDHVMETLDP